MIRILSLAAMFFVTSLGAIAQDAVWFPDDGVVCLHGGQKKYGQIVCDGAASNKVIQGFGYPEAINFVQLQQLTRDMDAMRATLQNDISPKVTQVADVTQKTNVAIVEKVNTFANDLRKAINDRFDELPAELAASDSIKKLKADLLKQMDDKIAAALKPKP